MTNEMLLIDRRQLRARLADALEATIGHLPPDTPRDNSTIFRRDTPLALSPLYDFLDSLDADIATLEGKP